MLGQKNVFGSFCLLVILPLAVFAAALAAYLGALPLLMPEHTIIMLAIMLLFALFFAPQNEYCQGAKLLKNQELFNENLSAYIKENSIQLGFSKKSSASFDEFFYDFLRRLKPLNFTHIASATFPMLGILGTFISIALSMPDFSSADAAGLELEISRLLGGIATAFYVSIYGIFLSIWWMFAARVGKGKIEKFYQKARHKSQAEFFHASDMQKFYYQQLCEQNERTLAMFNLLADSEFFSRLSKLHNDKFLTFNQLFKHYENMFSAQAELAQASLKISRDVQLECEKSFKEFLEQQRLAVNDFKQSAKELSEQVLSLKDAYAAEKEFSHLELLQDDIKELNQEAKDLFEKINKRE